MSSKIDSTNTLETVKIKSTTVWSIESSRKALTKLILKWAKAKEISDDFLKVHQDRFLTTLYQAKIEKSEEADILLDGIKQDIVGGNQVYGDKLWGYKKGAFIVCPNNKFILQSVLLRNILVLTGASKTPAQFSDKDLNESSDQNSFWSGFFSELYSTNPLKRIAPIQKKTTQYAAGVACMRLELYNLIRKESKHIGGQYWADVDFSVIGNPNKKEKKYLHIFLSTYVNGTLLSKTLSQLIAEYYASNKGAIVKRVALGSFLKDAKAVVALFNKHKVEKVAIGKGKKTKQVTRKVIIKPTKPSRLATIFALERNSISELCESAWSNLESAMVEFDKTQPLLRNYESFAKRAKELIKEQWDVKQITLNASKFRNGALDIDKDASASKKILEMRKITSTIELPSKQIYKDVETLYVNLFAKLKIKDGEGFNVVSLISFIKGKDMNKRFPITYKLIENLLEIGPPSNNVAKKELNSESLNL